jgi:hypothetical protein
MSNGSDQPQTALDDGFSFGVGELIPEAPYIFPGESELVEFCEFAALFGSYIPVFGWIVAIVAEIIEAVLELIDYLVSIFEGTPLQQKTLTVAGRLANGKSPIAQIMAAQINRNWSQNGIALSDSDASAQKILGAIRTQAEANLVTAGATVAQAKTAVDDVWTSTTSATQALPAILDQPLPPGITLLGDPAGQLAYAQHYNALIQKGDTPQQAARKTSTWLLNTGKMGWLSGMKTFVNPNQPPPTSPPPTSPPPPVGQPVPPPTPPSGPQPACPPFVSVPACLPQPSAADPLDDEVGNGFFGVAYWTQILAIYAMNVFQYLNGIPVQSDPLTCTQVGGFATLIATAVNNVAAAITALTPAPSGSPPGGGTPTPPPTEPITVVVQPAPVVIEPAPTNPAALPPSDPSVDEFIQQLANDGFFAPDVSQLVTS